MANATKAKRTRKSELFRLWKHLQEKENGCWEYEGQGVSYARFMNANDQLEYAHRVSWRLFRGAIPAGMFVLHECDNPKCCNPMHLFLGTQADNMRDKCLKGRQAKGASHGRSKLTEQDVIDIRASNDKQVTLAERYGVSQQLISFIQNYKIWTHLAA